MISFLKRLWCAYRHQPNWTGDWVGTEWFSTEDPSVVTRVDTWKCHLCGAETKFRTRFCDERR